jgi:anaphase-promoting complex subunit 11
MSAAPAAGGAAAPPAPPAAPAATGGKLGVRIVSWQAVAAWTWNAGDDVCGICRSAFDGCPPEAKYPGDDSPVVWGQCSHPFHLQCITKWLASQTEQRCPICRRAWEFKAAS